MPGYPAASHICPGNSPSLQLQISRPATSGAILPSIPCCRGSVFNAMDDITIAKPTRSHD
ncbi:hypothetical protein IG631_03905 [Alternaria alternata]|nr:hypothetical protein IG631_03905 [Alternaria alternata]